MRRRKNGLKGNHWDNWPTGSILFWKVYRADRHRSPARLRRLQSGFAVCKRSGNGKSESLASNSKESFSRFHFESNIRSARKIRAQNVHFSSTQSRFDSTTQQILTKHWRTNPTWKAMKLQLQNDPFFSFALFYSNAFIILFLFCWYSCFI